MPSDPTPHDDDIPTAETAGPVIPNYRTAIGTAWVTLGRYRLIEAQLALAKLQSEGIPCTLADINAAAMNIPHHTDVKLQVMPDDLERATTILKQRTPLPAGDEDEEYFEEPWRCSHCRKTNIGYVPLVPHLLYLSLLLLGLPLLFISRRKRCNDCGHTWAE
ncbi:MAG TPA: hypothetical protein VGQ99_16280 [Tepidisphaeraceae bacterium]|nr:hypothetical protein [Tepidisphaeraceae bacterium]